MPVIGTWHEDVEIIGIHAYHFHYDPRFMNNRQLDDVNHAMSNSPLVKILTRTVAGLGGESVESPPVIILRRMMRRVMPEFPVKSATGEFVAKWFPALEKKFKHHNVKNCKNCPHRGMPLKGLPVKDGAVTCNGHGLRWNVETGNLVAR